MKRLASENADSDFNSNQHSDAADFVAYSTPAQLPREAKPDKIYVDIKAEAVLLPINGMHVPFHISIIKNVHKMENAPYVYLTISFNTPDEKKEGKKQTDAKYIREVSYRTTGTSLDQTFFQIKELRKRVTNRMKEHEVTNSPNIALTRLLRTNITMFFDVANE